LAPELILILRFFWVAKFFDIIKIKMKFLDQRWSSEDDYFDSVKEIVDLYDTGMG
jgi:hypothetical protein